MSEEKYIKSSSRRALGAAAWLAAALLAAAPAAAQRAAEQDEQQGSSGTVGATTGTILNEAIELLNMEDYAGARAAIGKLRLDRLSPYERSRTEQVLFSIAYNEENFDEAREHLEQAIVAGGLNQQEISTLRYQQAQLFMQEERWAEGAAALERWFETEPNPNSAAYYLLAVAYYQLDDVDNALPAAEKAVELMEQPQENWITMLLALYLERERYRDAIPLLERLIVIVPEKQQYWVQLSSVYQQIEDYRKALATLQLAHTAGLLENDSELRRLADLLMFNQIPYRGAQLLEQALADGKVKADAQLFEKIANCWIAAREFDKALQPLERAASMSDDGDLFVRLGEVQMQREDWGAVVSALQRALEKGGLRDEGNAQLLMGIALFNQEEPAAARRWFERAARVERHARTARGYLQLIAAQAG